MIDNFKFTAEIAVLG